MSIAPGGDERVSHALVYVIPGTAFERFGFNHNYRITRSFSSASPGAMLLPDDPQPGEIHPFAFGVWQDPDRYPAEREGELLRRQLGPEPIPRLGGVFFFANLASCRRVSRQWPTWDLATVRAGTAHGRIQRFDMMLSSALLSPGLVTDPGARERLWGHYWQGLPAQGHPDLPPVASHSAPLWEFLLDGRVHFEKDDRSPFDT